MKKTMVQKELAFFFICLVSCFQTIGAAEKVMQLDSIIQYNRILGSYSMYLKTEFTYDLRRNETLKLVYFRKEASDGTPFWMYSQKSEKSYDEQNRLDNQKDYTWNANAGVWSSDTRKNKKFFYNKEIEGRVDSIFYYRWDGYEWLNNYEKEIYTYSADGLDVTSIWYKDLDYENENWPADWQPVEKRDWKYDEKGNLLSIIYYSRKGYYPSEEWVLSDKDEYTYDEHGNLLTSDKYMAILGSWVEASDNYKLRHEYEYNEDGDIISDKTYRISNGEWYLDTYYSFEYFYSEVPATIKEIPYTEIFDSQEAIDDYIMWDADNDGTVTWSWDNGVVKSAQKEYVGDYLFTPIFHLPVTHRYKVTFKVRCDNSEAGGKLAVGAYNAANPNNMIYSMLERIDIMNTDYQTYSATFLIPQEANYCIGFRTFTDDGSAIYLDDITVEKDKLLDIPEKIDYLVGIPAVGGEKKVTLNFYIPSVNIGGFLINGVNGYIIKRGDKEEPIYRNDKYQIRGDMITWEDMDALEGENTYSVYTFNEYGESDVATISVFIGMDYPSRVKNLQAKENEIGTCTLTWEAPTEGAAGGPFTQEGLTYNIYRYTANGLVLIDNGVEELTHTDTNINVSRGQTVLQYSVAAVNVTGEGYLASTPDLVLGVPYYIPFRESFADCGFTNYPWITIGVVGANSWGLLEAGLNPTVSAQDRDGGMAALTTTQFTPGNKTRLASPKIDINGVEKPEVSFWMAHSTTKGDDALVVMASADNGEFIQVGESIPVTSATEGWAQHKISLEAYKGCTNFRIGFVGIVGGTNNIYIDNIFVGEDNESSISAIGTNGVNVYGGIGAIYIEGVENMPVVISTIDGKTVYISNSWESGSISVPRGLYLVKVGESVIKVMVK